MKPRLQLSPKTTVKVLTRQRLIIASTGFAFALLFGAGLFMYGNFGNNTESLAALGSNMGFENGTGEWTAVSGTWTVNTNTSLVRSGIRSIAVNATTTPAKYRNTNSTITIPSSGVNYITVIAYARASSTAGQAMVGVFNTNTSTENMPLTATTLSTSSFTQLTYSFLATNGQTYIPQLQAQTLSGSSTIYFDDVIIYTSTALLVDGTAPTAPQTLKATPSGTSLNLEWTNGTDNESGVDGVMILRISGANITSPTVLNQVTYSTTSTVGPTTIGSYTVVYNGPVATSIVNNPGTAGAYTYLIYTRDKAYNYTTTPARMFVIYGNNVNTSISNNTQLSGLYIASTCTLLVSSSSTPSILSGSDIDIYGTIINTGNLLNNQGGTVRMKNGSVYIYNRNGSTSGFPVLNAIWEEGSTCRITGVTNQAPTGLNQTFHDFVWDCNGQTAQVQLPHNFNVNGNLSFIDSGPGNSVRTCWLNGTNVFKGNISCLPTADVCTYYGSKVKLSGTTPQTINYNLWFQNVEYNNPAGVIFTTDIWMDSLIEFTSGTVSMQSGKKFMTESGAMVYYKGGNINTLVEPWPYESNPTYDLNYLKGGTTGPELTTLSTYLGRLNINCPGEEIILDKDAIVNISLNLTAGKLITGNNMVWVKPTTANSVVANSTSSYVQGTLRRNISGSGTITYSFPIGSASSIQTVTIKSNSLTGVSYLTASFNSTFTGSSPNPNTCKINGTPITTLLNCGFWTVEPNQQPTSGNYEITLNAGGFTNPAASVLYYGVVKRNNSNDNWASIGTHSNLTQTLLNGIAKVVRSGLTSFSDFAVGYGGGVLPITLSDFRADKYENDKVMIRWVTSAELNNAYFSLERSSNGIDFEMINEQEGAGTSTIAHHYEYLDENPLPGINYYRLKQVDFDGQFTYGPIKQVTIGQRNTEHLSSNDINIFPNPNNGQFNIGGIVPQGTNLKVKVVVLDIKGSIVNQAEFSDGEPIKMDISDRPPGTYMVQVTDVQNRISIKQVVVNR